MRLIRVGAGVVNQTPLDWKGNKENILKVIENARAQGVQILCLPELSITGYGCEDAFHSVGVPSTALDILDELAEHTADLFVAVGLPALYQGSLYNVAAVIANGEIRGMTAKQTLAGDGLHYEPRWFKAWPARAVRSIQHQGRDIPFGDLLYDCDGIRIGFEICEDAWVAERPGTELAARGVDIILNPSASHFAFGKQYIRERFVIEGSRAYHTSYVYTNLVGNEAGRIIYDGGPMIASAGNLLEVGSRFSFQPHDLITALVDVDLTRMLRARSVATRHRLNEAADTSIRLPIRFSSNLPEKVQTPRITHLSKEEEFTHALTLALYDYFRKSHSRGFVVSLSGGADSAAVITLCSLMIQHVIAERGADVWAKHHPYLNIPDTASVSDVQQQLLFCVYQATRNSSQTTLTAAQTLAEALGSRFSHWHIDPLVDHCQQMVEGSLGRSLSWDKDDITLQNIQARVRSPGIWMLTNALGALLLSTSNRSEAAVGYATMDGDTSGGLSPIAGIDKAFLRKWLVWMERTGSDAFPPISALSLINAQAPTAELRPQEDKQTDESDLMPYPLLDAIERAAIRDKRMPVDVFFEMRIRFPEYAIEQLHVWIRRFFQLWSRNQWKRERYAPSFHLDDENLDPKTWCRFPILSAGFQMELEDLDALVKASS